MTAAFDPNTAKPVAAGGFNPATARPVSAGGFDPSSAKPVGAGSPSVLGQVGNAAKTVATGVGNALDVQRWAAAIDARPAVQRGRRVNCNWGDPAEQLPERHAASDFDSKS